MSSCLGLFVALLFIGLLIACAGAGAESGQYVAEQRAAQVGQPVYKDAWLNP